MRLAALLLVVGCSDPAAISTDYYQDVFAPLYCSLLANTHVQVASSGLVTGNGVTFPLEPSAEGELIVVAIAAHEHYSGIPIVAGENRTGVSWRKPDRG